MSFSRVDKVLSDIINEFCFNRDAHHTDVKINFVCVFFFFLDNCKISALIKQ